MDVARRTISVLGSRGATRRGEPGSEARLPPFELLGEAAAAHDAEIQVARSLRKRARVMLFWYLVLEWTLRIVMVPLVARRRSLVSALSWLAIIFFQPLVGVVLYFFLAEHFFARHVRRHRRTVDQSRSRERLAFQSRYHVPPAMHGDERALAELTTRLGGFELVGGNTVEYLEAHRSAMDRMAEDIRAARSFVHLLFYIFEEDDCGWEVARALSEAAGRGVDCRVLADAVGSRRFFKRVAPWLEERGVRAHRVLPFSLLLRRLRPLDLRNHRKLAVIDGRVAYTGSMNVVDAEESSGMEAVPWKDLMVRITGPAVLQLQLVFLEDWIFNVGKPLDGADLLPDPGMPGEIGVQVVPSGPTSRVETFHHLLVSALNAAEERVVVTTPYFIPDQATRVALELAQRRGARVELVVPVRSDSRFVTAASRAHYTELLDAGVGVHQHDSGFLHAKTITVDHELALIGSANFDRRSFRLNFELNLLVFGAGAVDRLVEIQERYLEESTPIDPDAWGSRPWIRRMGEDMARLVSPLL